MHSDEFRGERDDLHELALTKLAGQGAEDAGADRLSRVIDENGRVVVELDIRTVAAAALFHRANDYRLDARPLLPGSIGSLFLPASGHAVAAARSATRRPSHPAF